MPHSTLICGCGYLGERVAALRLAAGDAVSAVTRSAACAASLQESGIGAVLADVTHPATLRNLPTADSLLYAVGFDRASAPDIHAVYATGLANVLAALPSSIQRVIYISTTGVYGPHSGEWVDEQTPPDPQREGGRASLAAEQILAAHPLGHTSAVLRLAGIYGPGRIPHLDKLLAGDPIPVPAEGWLNLIHVEDAARLVVATDAWLADQAANHTPPSGPHVVNVTDGAPVRRADYYAEAARLLGAPPPRFIAPPPDSPAAARAASNRRISNAKLRTTLPVALQYPTYREGLAAILSVDS